MYNDRESTMNAIASDRLVLRPWADDDAPALYALACDPEVGPAAGWPAHTSEAESLQTIRDVLSVPDTYAVCLRSVGPAGEPAGTLVGAIALKDATSSAFVAGAGERELGYWIGRPFWGRGYAPEAARALIDHARCALGLSTIWLGYYAGNRKSARVQHKLGFRYVRTDRDVEVPLLGEVRDEVVNRLDLETPPTAGDMAAEALAILCAQPCPERFLSITEPLKLGRMTVCAAGEDLGVLTRLAWRGTYFAAPFSREAAGIMAGLVPAGELVSLIDERYLVEFANGSAVDPGRYELWALDGAMPSSAVGPAGTPNDPVITTLGPDALDVVDAHYDLLDRAAIKDHLKRGWVRGGIDATGALVGFIGEHEEASMGMLEVVPAARRRGYAAALERALVNELREAGRTPFCHVAPDNEASRGLQRKLGLRRVGNLIQCWFEMPQHRAPRERPAS